MLPSLFSFQGVISTDAKPDKKGLHRKGRGNGKERMSGARRTKGKEVFSDIVGVFNGEGPPVPIPNTEVKLIGAENTRLATGWKNRSTPT